MRKIVIRAVVIGRRVKRSPVVMNFARDFVMSTATSSATDIILHHKPPHVALVMDVAMSNGIALCIRIVESNLI